jgi:RsiW-degrading membrane proteinase PrsW (M82 family)
MTLQLVTIALSPAIAMVWFFYARQAYRPERKGLITLLFVLGALSGLVALVLNHSVERYTQLWSGAPEPLHRTLFWVLGIGLNEEFAKTLMLLLVLYPRRDFTTPYQGLLGGATVALGFAAVENLFYLERCGTATLLFRSLLTVPAHAFFTAPLGVALGFSKRAETVGRKYLWLVGGLAFAMLTHGLYDIWLSLDSIWLNRVAYLHVVAMGGFTLWLMRLRLPPLPAPPRSLLP